MPLDIVKKKSLATYLKVVIKHIAFNFKILAPESQ